MSSRRRVRRARGYTVVEVMSAMTLFAVGAAGVISMQRVTIQGGEDARRLDVGTNIANEWIGRLQRDATYWTEPNLSNQTSSNHTTATLWLKNVTAGTTAPTAGVGWITTAPGASDYMGKSNAFDIFGRDLPPGGGHIFCAQYRLSWITEPSAGLAASRPLMRAEVRVFWRRLEEAPIGDCAASGLDPEAEKTRYHMVYATTAVRPSFNQ